jgi:hypothetical protein
MGQVGVRGLLDINLHNLTVIMRNHAKITGYNTTYNANAYVPIRISANSTSYRSIFYMEGGEISGNTFGQNWGVAFLAGRNNKFYKTGGIISGNTKDRVVEYSANTEVDTTPPSGWAGAVE